MDNKLVELIWYLVGERPKSDHSIAWNWSKRECFPVVTSPMANYLNAVNRFLFSGGIQVDVFSAEADDARQKFLDEVMRDNHVLAILDSLWEVGAITGEVLADIELLENGKYNFEWYDATQFTYSKGAYDIKFRVMDGEVESFFRKRIWRDRIDTWPLVPVKVERAYDWELQKETLPHSYGFHPCQLIKNSIQIGKKRGCGEFNFGACRMAVAELMTMFDGLENVHLFGNPIIASADPAKMLSAIKKRLQVVEKSIPEDGGAPEVLTFQAISEQHLSLIDKAHSNFMEFMGIQTRDNEVRGDLSSIALKILNSSTISIAEKKWANFVDDGLKPMLEKVLVMAAVDGQLGQVDANNYDTYRLTVHRQKPYFPESPQERIQLATLAQSLVDLGIDRTRALRETIFPGYSLAQIEEMIRPGADGDML